MTRKRIAIIVIVLAMIAATLSAAVHSVLAAPPPIPVDKPQKQVLSPSYLNVSYLGANVSFLAYCSLAIGKYGVYAYASLLLTEGLLPVTVFKLSQHKSSEVTDFRISFSSVSAYIVNDTTGKGFPYSSGGFRVDHYNNSMEVDLNGYYPALFPMYPNSTKYIPGNYTLIFHLTVEILPMFGPFSGIGTSYNWKVAVPLIFSAA